MYFYVILTFGFFIAFKIYKSFKVPEGLENIPTLSSLAYLIEIITNAGLDKRWENSRETLEKEGIAKIWNGGKWVLMVSDLEFTREIFANTDLFPKISFAEIFPRSIITQLYGTNLVLSTGDVWKRHRRVANPAFRKLPLHVFTESTMELLEIMEKVDNEPIEIKSLMHRLTLDVLGKASFGFDFHNLKDPNNTYVSTYNGVMKEVSNLLYFIVPFLDYLPRTKAREEVVKLHSLIDKIVESKRKSIETGELDKRIEDNSADLLDCMIYASKDPENLALTDEELRYNVAIFMFAGHDTTANALTTFLYLLAIHKDVQKKVRDEILYVLGDDLIPSMEQQKELKYMSMVINENLRLYPPVARLPRRYALKDVKFGNHIIPANTHLSISIYGVNHSSKNWEDPEKFNPERFKNDQQKHDSFGGGSRSCIGTNFSLIEQKVVLCSLLRKYEVSLPADSIHKDKLKIAPEVNGTMGSYPIPMIFKRRTE